MKFHDDCNVLSEPEYCTCSLRLAEPGELATGVCPGAGKGFPELRAVFTVSQRTPTWDIFSSHRLLGHGGGQRMVPSTVQYIRIDTYSLYRRTLTLNSVNDCSQALCGINLHLSTRLCQRRPCFVESRGADESVANHREAHETSLLPSLQHISIVAFPSQVDNSFRLLNIKDKDSYVRKYSSDAALVKLVFHLPEDRQAQTVSPKLGTVSRCPRSL